MEIVNTMYILNAQKALVYKLENSRANDPILEMQPLGRSIFKMFDENELEALNEFGTMNGINIENIITFGRDKIGKEKYTSEIYQRQKKKKKFLYLLGSDLFWQSLMFLRNGRSDICNDSSIN